MKTNLIVYYSTTNNVKRFLEKVRIQAAYEGHTFEIMNFKEYLEEGNSRDFHFFTPTRGFGLIPEPVLDFLSPLVVKECMISVSGSGNRNWGKNFCKAVDKISEKYCVPDLIRIELTGTSKDVHSYIQKIINF